MENTNRSDATEFFEKMPYDLQIEAIRNLNKQKKPPDGYKSLYDSYHEAKERMEADIARKDSVV